MQWLRRAADNGHELGCPHLAMLMYIDRPHARDAGRVVENTGDAALAMFKPLEGHDDVPPHVLADVLYWLRSLNDPVKRLGMFRVMALEGIEGLCCNEGCEVKGQLKDFKVCVKCKSVRYCSVAW